MARMTAGKALRPGAASAVQRSKLLNSSACQGRLCAAAHTSSSASTAVPRALETVARIEQVAGLLALGLGPPKVERGHADHPALVLRLPEPHEVQTPARRAAREVFLVLEALGAVHRAATEIYACAARPGGAQHQGMAGNMGDHAAGDHVAAVEVFAAAVLVVVLAVGGPMAVEHVVHAGGQCI